MPSSTTVMDHSFEGWSVWLEIDDKHVVADESQQLHQAYSHRRGVDPFVPHITLLYNLPPDSLSEDPAKLLETINMRFQQSSSCSLKPTDFHFFHYPKSADDGKGFGCVISMILVEKSEWMEELRTVLKDYFPQDERGGNFTPHMSLLYAPEADFKAVESYTEGLRETRKDLLSPMPARFLSLWSTQGGIKDWYRIARVEL